MTTVWDRMVGQDQAVRLLQVAAERPVHAYLLVGARGSGVEDAARCFAAALVAPDGDERITELVLRGQHPDVVEIEPELTVISIRQAREEIIPEASRSPVEGGRKAILVAEAEKLHPNAAGALLKTLEEPPASTFFVLVTSSPDELLDTVRSRCQRIDFSPLDEATIGATLERGGIDHDTAELAARLGGGHLGRARALAGEWRGLRDAFASVPGRLDGTGAAVAAVAAELVAAGEEAIGNVSAEHERELATFDAEAEASRYTKRDLAAIRRRMTTRHHRRERSARRQALLEGITAIETVYRDALAGPDAPRRNVDRSAPPFPAATCLRALDACREARQAVESNPNEALLLERLLLRLGGAPTTHEVG